MKAKSHVILMLYFIAMFIAWILRTYFEIELSPIILAVYAGSFLFMFHKKDVSGVDGALAIIGLVFLLLFTVFFIFAYSMPERFDIWTGQVWFKIVSTLITTGFIIVFSIIVVMVLKRDYKETE